MKTYKKRAKLFSLALGILSLLIMVLILWQSRSLSGRWNPRWEIQQRILLERFEKMQNLQVLSSHLLAHERFRNPAFLNASEFVLISRAKAVYGIELSKVKLERQGNTLQVELPPVRVQDLIMNARDVEFIGLKKGFLTSQVDFENFKQTAVKDLHGQLARQARDPKLISEATTQAQQYFKTLFEAAGFESVIFYEKKADPR